MRGLVVSGGAAGRSVVRPDDFRDVVRANTFKTADGSKFGYLRLWSFDLVDDQGFIDHIMAELEKLPRRGLIIDLRSNLVVLSGQRRGCCSCLRQIQ